MAEKKSDQYGGLIDCSRKVSHTDDWKLKIENDPEVRAFIDAALPHHYFGEIEEKCKILFGADRAPGTSTIHRYWQRQRRAPKNGRL